MHEFKLKINGKEKPVWSAPARRLTDILRNDLQLTGTKVGCDAGDCGACTILLDGKQVCACLVPVAQANGSEILTVEGLNEDGNLNTLQDSFHRHGAAQCGICTPGMLMAATELLRKNSQPSEQQINDALGGVLCRCTGYRKIIEAILYVSNTTLLTQITQPGVKPLAPALLSLMDNKKLMDRNCMAPIRLPKTPYGCVRLDLRIGALPSLSGT